ncbi:hypothetical protein [Actinoplanes philippinensis]|uniref:hypothetical protein n=1 Tax=Actinoplanes philippinensis TaxID=35752 RepID=UPI0033F3E791
MNHIKVEVVGRVDADWPSWIEVRLREADGNTTAIIEKVPVLLSDELPATEPEIHSHIYIPCDVLEREQDAAGRVSVLVRLHFHIQDQRGRSVFRVPECDVTGPRQPGRNSAPRRGSAD